MRGEQDEDGGMDGLRDLAETSEGEVCSVVTIGRFVVVVAEWILGTSLWSLPPFLYLNGSRNTIGRCKTHFFSSANQL